MILFRRIFLLLVIAILAVSCGTNSTGRRATRVNNSEFVAVAVIDGNNASIKEIVASELSKNGIECYMEGSLGYAVMVPKPLVKKASEILLKSQNVKSEWLLLLKDNLK